MSAISLKNAVDMHIHTHPCLIPRIGDDRKIIRLAEEAGLSAVLLKCHHESTVSRAYTLQSEFEKIKVYGGIVLNEYVGGINPKSVEAALRLGGKEVWMPTIDADYHARVHGSKGVYDVQSSGSKNSEIEGVTVLEDGQLSPEIKEVFALVAEHNAILGTSHLSKEEIKLLTAGAKEAGVKKIVITHPYFKVPDLSLVDMKELAENEAVMFEFGYCTVSPMWNYATIEQVYRTIKELGVERCLLISDGGQTHNPLPHEGLKIFAQCLLEKGLTQEEIDRLIRENPRKLLLS